MALFVALSRMAEQAHSVQCGTVRGAVPHGWLNKPCNLQLLDSHLSQKPPPQKQIFSRFRQAIVFLTTLSYLNTSAISHPHKKVVFGSELEQPSPC